MKKIRYTLLVLSLLSILPVSSQDAIRAKLQSCNAIEVKGTLSPIDDNEYKLNANCSVDFHYNLKSQLFPEGGWYIMLYCPQLDLNEIEQCGRSDVTIKKGTENFGKNRGKSIQITIGPNELASLLFIPSLNGNYPVICIEISGRSYGIQVKSCNFVKVGNHKREKVEIEYTKSTLSNILNSWFNIVASQK